MKFVGDNCAFLTIVLCSGECVIRMMCVRVSVRARECACECACLGVACVTPIVQLHVVAKAHFQQFLMFKSFEQHTWIPCS